MTTTPTPAATVARLTASDLRALARKSAGAREALNLAIVAHRKAGRSLRAIGDEAGLTSAGVLGICRRYGVDDVPE